MRTWESNLYLASIIVQTKAELKKEISLLSEGDTLSLVSKPSRRTRRQPTQYEPVPGPSKPDTDTRGGRGSRNNRASRQSVRHAIADEDTPRYIPPTEEVQPSGSSMSRSRTKQENGIRSRGKY